MEYIKLSNIAKISSGQNAPQGNSYYSNGENIFIKVSNLDDLIEDECENRASRVTDDAIIKCKLKKYPKGSIIFAKSGLSCNKNRVYLTKEDSFIVNHLCVLYDIDINYNSKWLSYFIKFHNVTRYIKDASYPSISLFDIGNIDIPIISKDIQDEIVKNVDKISSIIKRYRIVFNKMDKIVKSQFIEMFENEGYELVPIRELVDTKKISAKKLFKSDEKIKYIDISSIDNKRNIIIGYTPYIMKEAPSRAQQCLRKNDILISTVRPNLRNIAIFKEDDFDYVGSSGFCILRAKRVNYEYLKYVVLDDKFTNAMVDLTTGASYPAIREEDVLNYSMINAPIELQNKFASFVQQIDKSKYFGGIYYGIC